MFRDFQIERRESFCNRMNVEIALAGHISPSQILSSLDWSPSRKLWLISVSIDGNYSEWEIPSPDGVVITKFVIDALLTEQSSLFI